MKSLTYKNIGIYLLLSLMIFTGCKRTITIKTNLYGNGSLKRVVSISSDSTGVGKTAYPFPQDGSWDMLTHKDSANSYTYMISKNFADVDMLNKEIIYREDSLQFNALATLAKKFRWFYTYYRYEETFYKTFPFTGANILDYVTTEELASYQAGNDSTGIEDRIEEYAAHAMFNEFYEKFVAAVEESSIDIDQSTLDLKKEELYKKLDEWDLADDEDDFGLYFLRVSDLVYAPQKSFTVLEPTLRETSVKFNQYIEDLFSGRPAEDYRYTVNVPGRVVDTNANRGVKNREAIWEFSTDHFTYSDYTVWVESRRLNIVPSVITAIFIFIGLFLLWLSARRSRREKLASQGMAWEDRKRLILPWWLSSIVILIGLALAAWFGWMHMIFHTDPFFLLLDVFGAGPEDNWWMLSIVALGLLLAVWGIYQVMIYLKRRKK
jgi:hypothetical protein